MRWAWLSLLWLLPRSTLAQSDNGFALQLRAPEGEGCIDAETLTRQLEARTARSALASDSSAAVRVSVRIEATAHGYSARISIQGSERDLLSDGPCSELDEMLVVVITSSLGITPATEAPAKLQKKCRDRSRCHSPRRKQTRR